jgi:translation elongation factor EF-G
MARETSTGFELTDVLVSVEDGSYHEEDSTANAFREAAEKAAREAILQASPIVLEALSSVTITVPEDFVAVAEATVDSHEGRVRATPVFQARIANTGGNPVFIQPKQSHCGVVAN